MLVMECAQTAGFSANPVAPLGKSHRGTAVIPIPSNAALLHCIHIISFQHSNPFTSTTAVMNTQNQAVEQTKAQAPSPTHEQARAQEEISALTKAQAKSRARALVKECG
jgi:hypothetical protein